MKAFFGQTTAALYPRPRRWLQRWWGYPDIHTRQKWHALRPHLKRLPPERLHLLDAGCGEGRWTLELASMRPRWSITGLDREGAQIERAKIAQRALGLKNVSFRVGDFLHYRPDQTFDVILSVASAHYLVEEGKGPDLFASFVKWLKPGGVLILLGPRRREETPFVNWLPRPQWHDVYKSEDLVELCRASRLDVELLTGRVGPLGTFAKQLDWLAQGLLRPLIAGIYPLEWVLTSLDSRQEHGASQATLMWVLVARSRTPAASVVAN